MSESETDPAPTVYLEDGTPVKVRMVGRECEGDLSGEGHFAYRQTSTREESPTVFFEPVGCPVCPHGCGDMVLPVGDPMDPAGPYCPDCGHIKGNGCDDGCYYDETERRSVRRRILDRIQRCWKITAQTLEADRDA